MHTAVVLLIKRILCFHSSCRAEVRESSIPSSRRLVSSTCCVAFNQGQPNIFVFINHGSKNFSTERAQIKGYLITLLAVYFNFGKLHSMLNNIFIQYIKTLDTILSIVNKISNFSNKNLRNSIKQHFRSQ